jgi:biopolymer transport protein ExbD
MPAPYRPRTPHEDRPTDLNMTPMIDVVFQLLIFFMLSMHFRESEGKLITTLPKDKGLRSSASNPELNEVRIILCACGPGSTGAQYGGVASHRSQKVEHERIQKDASVTKAVLAGVEHGDLLRTEDRAEAGPANRRIFRDLAQKARELRDRSPSSRDPSRRAPLIVDADSETPYEHVIGIVNALRELQIDDVEFAGNPRFVGKGRTRPGD